MKTYRQMRQEHQKRVHEFLDKYAFFAFNQKQFQDGCARLGIEGEPEDALYKLQSTGGFVLKSKWEEYAAIANSNHKEMQDALADPVTGYEFACQMFKEEMNNHEFSYTGDPFYVLDALGYDPEDIQADEMLKKAFNDAAGFKVF